MPSSELAQRNQDALASGDATAHNREARDGGVPGLGLLKGLGVTIKNMLRPASTQQYPHVKPDLPPRTRGVIALMDENCTVCMLCSRECPDWCIYIESHKETVPPAKEGGRERTRNVLDRFAIDFALCMYCGICVEVCPFDALFWSPEFEYSEYAIDEMTHEMGRLREWMDTVPAPPPLEEGADVPDEVQTALDKAEREVEQARQQAIEEQSGAKEEAEKPAAKKATATTAPKEEVHVADAGEIDQETYDQLIAEGKSERIARAKAKAAYVRKRKKELRAQAEAEGGAEGAPEAQQTAAPADADVQAEASPEAEPAKKKSLADVHVEGAGENLDQEVYDQLIAEGKSERIARAKAKAAWVKAEKRKKLEEEGGDG